MRIVVAALVAAAAGRLCPNTLCFGPTILDRADNTTVSVRVSNLDNRSCSRVRRAHAIFAPLRQTDNPKAVKFLRDLITR